MTEENITLYEPGNFEDQKRWRIEEIDLRTVELINEGFTFDSNIFSLSEPAQTNWLGLKSLELLLSWPVNISTKDNEEYSLAQADLDDFEETALAVKQGYLDSGRTLKISISNATTQQELDAIVDNR